MAPLWSQPWLPSRPGLAAQYENVALLVDLGLLTTMPNTFNWPLSRLCLCGWRTRIRPTLLINGPNIGLSPATPSNREQWLLIFHTCDPLSVPSLQMVDGSMVTVLASLVLSYSLSSSTSETGGLLSSPQCVPRCGLLARPPSPCAPFPVSPLPCLRSDTVWLVLCGAPRSLSVVRSSGVCWTRPFSFSDSSLAGLRPFSLPMFHPAHALGVLFVALCCLLRYWLGFYLNWQLMTTVSLSLTFRQIHLVHNNICSKPLFTKFNRLSIFVANSQILICLTLRICSIFQPILI